MTYKALVRPVLSYASETWPLSRPDERISIFERMILIYIFGPVEENGAWKKVYKLELYKLFNEPDIIGFIRVKRLEWPGHLIRASEIFNIKPQVSRKVGRPGLRWECAAGHQDFRRKKLKECGIE
jgi:hypothetical protein